MSQVILIKTTPDRYQWLQMILESLDGYSKYPIVIYSQHEIYLHKLAQNIDAEEVVFLHDSMEILDTSMFDILFKKNKGISTAFVGDYNDSRSNLLPYAGSLGKFLVSKLKQIEIPPMTTRKADLEFEPIFVRKYLELAPDTQILCPNISHDSNIIAEKCGRQNVVMETPYYRKYRRKDSNSEEGYYGQLA